MLGTFVLSTGYYDAYYTKAQKYDLLVDQPASLKTVISSCHLLHHIQH